MSDEMVVTMPIRLEYTHRPGFARSRFLRKLAQGIVTGQKCPQCGKVYVPPTDFCSKDGIPLDGEVVLPDTGVVTMFCVVNIPFAGQAVPCPYVSASILFDGADLPIFHLVQEVDAGEVRMGMRVKAVWEEPGSMSPSFETIRYFKPTGEPDTPLDEILGRIHVKDL